MKVNIPSQKVTILQDDLFSTPWYSFFENAWRRLGGGRSLNFGGILNTSTTAVGNVGTGEDDLITYSLERNTLQNDGELLKIDAFGTFASNGNNKTVKLYFGSTVIFDSGANAINGGSWNIKATIIRASSTTQEAIVEATDTSNTLNTTTYTAVTENLSNALTIKCTGEGTANDDIVQKALVTNLFLNL